MSDLEYKNKYINETNFTKNKNVENLISFIKHHIKLIKTKITNDINTTIININKDLNNQLEISKSTDKTKGIWYGAWVDFGLTDNSDSKLYLIVKDLNIL